MLVVLARDWSTEAATRESPASRKNPAGVAAARQSTAARVPFPHGRPCRTGSESEHQEGCEEQYWQPTVPRSCVGHDHKPEATPVPAAQEDPDRQKALSRRGSPLESRSRCRRTTTYGRHVPTCRRPRLGRGRRVRTQAKHGREFSRGTPLAFSMGDRALRSANAQDREESDMSPKLQPDVRTIGYAKPDDLGRASRWEMAVAITIDTSDDRPGSGNRNHAKCNV